MIETVYLENYKCYGPDGAKFDLKPLTFLYGTNGAGKSTFFDGLIQLREWEKGRSSAKDLDECVFKKEIGQSIGIGLTLSGDQGPVKLFKRVCKKGDDWVVDLDKMDPAMEGRDRASALKQLMGMRHMYASRPFDTAAKQGQVSSLTDLDQPDDARMNGVKAVSCADEINHLLAQIGLDDFEFISRERVKDKLMGIDIQWENTGAGIHGVAFTLDSIVRLVPNGILLLEEPETHIDPRYLGAFARVLVDAIHARKGSQIIMECHSEHLMLAIKGLIRMKVLNSSEVTAIHVCRSSNGAITTQIPLAEDGTFVQEWPDGGFYQERWDLITMGAQ